jgi:hypothetical protein
MNYAGETVTVEHRGDITTNPALSLWRAEGFTLPEKENLISFREQAVGGHVAMVIQWMPAARDKSKDEVNAT